jgi:hypothetical protein
MIAATAFQPATHLQTDPKGTEFKKWQSVSGRLQRTDFSQWLLHSHSIRRVSANYFIRLTLSDRFHPVPVTTEDWHHWSGLSWLQFPVSLYPHPTGSSCTENQQQQQWKKKIFLYSQQVKFFQRHNQISSTKEHCVINEKSKWQFRKLK